jgi:hypothetical protein
MKVTISPAIEQSTDLYQNVQEANRFLMQEAGSHADNLAVEWQVSSDWDRLIELKVSDGVATITPTVHRNTLADQNARELLLLKSWGYILGVHSKQNLDLIQQLIGEAEQEDPAYAAS